MRKRIAITGTSGRVGRALADHFSVGHEVIELPRKALDLTDSAEISRVLKSLECDVFLNPGGMTSLEACEDDPRTAMRANSRGPGMIAEWAADNGVRMIQFSTDYVFGGETAGLRVEADAPAPLSAYGRSKLAGERSVLAFPGHLVLRVSWVFGPEKVSFIDSVFHSVMAGQPLAAVADKFSLPTFTADLAGWVEKLLKTEAAGVLHACNSGEPVSWHGMAEAIVEEMSALGLLGNKPEVARQRLAEMKNFRAARPVHTAMDSTRLSSLLGRPIRPWHEAVREYLARRHGRSISTMTGK